MSPASILFCLQVFVVQNAISQCFGPGRAFFNRGSLTADPTFRRVGYPNALMFGPRVGLPSEQGMTPMFGTRVGLTLDQVIGPLYRGNGGHAGVIDDVLVSGTAGVSGQVPIVGGIIFVGDVPAAGAVTMVGQSIGVSI